MLIPIYIAMFTAPQFFNNKEEYGSTSIISAFIIVIVIVVFLCLKHLYDAYEKVNFYNDFIRIAEEELMEKQVKKNDECNG